jgi:predicted lipid-binding transport protein (Tim44 family)
MFLGLGLIAGLSLGVHEFFKGMLPAVDFGIILVLLMIAFITGISLILRATSRQIRRHLTQAAPAVLGDRRAANPVSVLSALRGK